MKAVVYQPAIRQAAPLYDLAQKATQRLDVLLGSLAPEVEAEWGTAQDEKGRSVATLRLRDLPEEGTTAITPEQLGNEIDLDLRLLRVWGDVLRERSHRLLRGLLEMEVEGSNGDGE